MIAAGSVQRDLGSDLLECGGAGPGVGPAGVWCGGAGPGIGLGGR